MNNQRQEQEEDYFEHYRRQYQINEVFENYYDTQSERGKKEHMNRLLWFLIAFPAFFFVSLQAFLASDAVNHQDLKNVTIRLEEAIPTTVGNRENISGDRYDESSSMQQQEKAEVIKGPILDVPNDNYLQKLSKDVRRYPVIWGIIGLNCAMMLMVKGFKRSPRFHDFYSKHLTVSVHNLLKRRYHTLLTSTFVHGDWLHLGFCMYGLYNMGSLTYDLMGPTTFLLFYLGAGMTASMGSSLLKLITKNYYQRSVGSSGSIFAIVFAGLNVITFEKAKMNLIFLPDSWGGFNATYFLPLYFVGEILYNIFSRRVKLDTGGHLSGALAGYLALEAMKNQSYHKQTRKVEFSGRNTYYLGEVKDLKKNGAGALIGGNMSYVGNFKDGNPEGQGIVIVNTNEGTKAIKGIFKNGNFTPTK
ncbi:predicted protein [Naegleria gruberi]|uniref:Predicted protein n=1 Tax=Naegleria gruberi TaxID=5762 RepID=D2VYZ2_NAEGR|nr:uncharacterized protein NAEGRDRAFT_74295 [Naegleria gruberi]EFC37992.1 predicted protein [Naegleria gruberi]|eukprot:XP_002670736.1 predicted protein [Naegleria gruberi strain NEG-M]